jgi:hypothetical protein
VIAAGDRRDTHGFLDSSGNGVEIARAVDHVIDTHRQDRNRDRNP